MKASSVSAKANLFNTQGLTGSLLRRGVLRQLTQLKHGQLVLIEDGVRHVFGSASHELLGRSISSMPQPGDWWRATVRLARAKRSSRATGVRRT